MRMIWPLLDMRMETRLMPGRQERVLAFALHADEQLAFGRGMTLQCTVAEGEALLVSGDTSFTVAPKKLL